MSNMYDWVDKWIDPIRFCSHNCSYCYAIRWQQKEPKIIEEQLIKIRGKNKKIFIGHLGDMFCEDIPPNIIEKVLMQCNLHENAYILQSKNPKRFTEFIHLISVKSLLGTTMETDNWYLLRHYTKAPDISERAYWIDYLRRLSFRTFITIEPIMKFSTSFANMIIDYHPGFVNIGADSKRHCLPEPTESEIIELVNELKNAGIEVRLKSNLARLAPSFKELVDRIKED